MNRKFKMIPIRLLSLALCVLLLCGSAPAAGMTYFADLLSLSAAAESYSGTCGDTLTWTLEDGVLTISGTGEMADYQINRSPWYDYRESVQSVVLQDGITSIGIFAFNGCPNLENVTIPDGVTKIGNYAFEECKSLTSITIPNSVTDIGIRVFGSCFGLTNLTIPDSVTSIGSQAFSRCLWLQHVTLPGKLTSIGDSFFYDCSRLTDISIPDSVTSIGYQAFYNCSSLTSITIPDKVTDIGDSAFYQCRSLTNITIPDGVTSIGREAFRYCYSLTDITIPDSVTSIPIHSFNGCSALKTVTIGNGVKNIGQSAFYKCGSLTDVTIGSGVTIINKDAFAECTNLARVNYTGTLAQWCAITFGSSTASSLTANPLYYAQDLYTDGKLLTEADIPDGASRISNHAFYNCASLTRVTIPDSVTNIGYSAFGNCTGLQQVTIGSGVTSIGSDAFIHCTNLDSITVSEQSTVYSSDANGILFSKDKSSLILYPCGNPAKSYTVPDGLSNIGYYAFYNCANLERITIPESVTNIAAGAFYGCTALEEITVDQNNTVYSSDESGMLYSKDGNTLLRCTSKQADEHFAVPDNVTSIGASAFAGCTGLQSVFIPSGVTSIGSGAFSGCTNLAYLWSDTSDCAAKSYAVSNGIEFRVYRETDPDEIIIGACGDSGSGVKWELNTTTGAMTVSGTGRMKSFTVTYTDAGYIPDTPWYAYRDAIQTVTIGSGVTNIGSHAFRGCTNLTSLTIPAAVTSIGTSAFEGCTKLVSVYYTGTLAQWCGISFSGSASSNPIYYTRDFYADGQLLTEALVIPDSVTRINYCAFSGYKKLTSVTIPTSVTQIGAHAFEDCTNLANVYYTGTLAQWCGILFSSTYANPVSVAHNLYIDGQLLTEADIPDGMTKIGQSTFEGCTNLTRVTIPDSVQKIGSDAFKDCTNLASIYYTGTFAQWYAIEFGNSSSMPPAYDLYLNGQLLTDIVILGGTTTIDSYRFYNCTSITSVTIPSGITGIGTSAFANCTNLAGITIPDSVTGIGPSAFENCTSLESITIPDGVTKIESSVFQGCKSLMRITIPNHATSIGNYAFYKCASLTDVTIPDSVTELGSYAFLGCTALADVTIGSGITDISGRFYNCESLERFTVSKGNPAFSTDENGILYNLDGSELLRYTTGNPATHFTIPDSVTVIGKDAFESGKHLMTVTIPDSVTTIRKEAFSSCTNLRNATVPDSVTEIGYYAFANCANLTGITLPNGITNIADGTFMLCTRLKTITIPNNVTHIERSAFAYCTGLESVTLLHGVTEIGDNAFRYCTALKSVAIPDSVTHIAYDAFVLHVPADELEDMQNDYDAALLSGDTSIFYGILSLQIVKDLLDHPQSSLTDVYYEGDRDDWAAIEIGTGNDDLLNATFRYLSEIPPHTHLYTEEVTKEPSCTEAGIKTFTCTCGDSYTESIPTLGHDYDAAVTAPTCTDGGFTTYTCTRCGDRYTADQTDPLGHDYNAAVTVPTCTEGGFTTYTCTRCGDRYTADETDPLGHAFGAWVLITEPTTETEGKETRTCSRCGLVQAQAIPKRTQMTDGKTDISVDFGQGSYADPDALHLDIQAMDPAKNEAFLHRIKPDLYTQPVSAYTIKIADESGSAVQPQAGHPVTIRIPIPDGLVPESCVIVHVTSMEPLKTDWYIFNPSPSGTAKPFTISGRYFILEVSSFSPFVIFTESALQLGIAQNADKSVLPFGEKRILTADVQDLPNGAKVVWEADEQYVMLKPSADTRSCEVTAKKSGKVTITAKITDANGNVIEQDGKAVSDSLTLRTKAGFFHKLFFWIFRIPWPFIKK